MERAVISEAMGSAMKNDMMKQIGIMKAISRTDLPIAAHESLPSISP